MGGQGCDACIYDENCDGAKVADDHDDADDHDHDADANDDADFNPIRQ